MATTLYLDSDRDRWKRHPKGDHRSDFMRDLSRLIHSPSFRRLQGKTQLFPGSESDFFRNRLSHSMEVAQIAKSIGLYIKEQHESLRELDLDLLEFAGLAHDLGHPPFGHQGEEALDECMIKFGGFEGNAQTLRILSKVEKKELLHDQAEPIGLNLCARTLASILKYDNQIPSKISGRRDYANSNKNGIIAPVKGYYFSEKNIVDWVKEKVALGHSETFKTIECQIMDVADDIAYSTFDLEDSFKAGFLTPAKMLFPEPDLANGIKEKVSKKIKKDISKEAIIGRLHFLFSTGDWYKEGDSDLVKFAKIFKTSEKISQNGYYRVPFMSQIINRFVSGVKVVINNKYPSQTEVELTPETRIDVEILKQFAYLSQIQSPKLKIVEIRGKEIVKKIFETLQQRPDLLPDDFQNLYLKAKTKAEKNRTICDYIAGMTDRYAIEFYGRLTSENPETIFKPL